MFVFGGKYINGDIVEASHTPQMAHGVSQVTNTLPEETPNTHQKSQKILWKLVGMEKNKLAFLSWLYILPFWTYLFFLRIFSHIFHMCFGSNTTINRHPGTLATFERQQSPAAAWGQGQCVSSWLAASKHMGPMCFDDGRNPLASWERYSIHIMLFFFSPRFVHAKWCRISSVASVDKIPKADLEAWYMSDLWV